MSNSLYLMSRVSSLRSPTRLNSISSFQIRFKSEEGKNQADQKVDLKSYYYPNTSVGIKERSIKPDQQPGPPMQTPYPPFPNNTNPKTGEKGGPAGPEPTRFGDWERKGRVSDF